MFILKLLVILNQLRSKVKGCVLSIVHHLKILPEEFEAISKGATRLQSAKIFIRPKMFCAFMNGRASVRSEL